MKFDTQGLTANIWIRAQKATPPNYSIHNRLLDLQKFIKNLIEKLIYYFQDLRKTATLFRIAKNLTIPRKQKLRKLLIYIEFNNI
ncbi:MAG: hypothetical protein ACK542_06405 [Burkholderiales bacterium]